MYSIYFENRSITITPDTGQFYKDSNSVLFNPGDSNNLSHIPLLFDKITNIPKLYIQSTREDESFRHLFTNLTPINAAGGVVTNKRGEYLFIFRHGKWDLPKGKQEEGEDTAKTALREVMEECGIDQVEVKEHICDTFHTYHRDGLFWIKRTSWFKMNYMGNGTETHPQEEEDIERAVWVPKERLAEYLANTYPSIREVLG